MNRIKLKKILKNITPDKTEIDFSIFDKKINELKNRLTVLSPLAESLNQLKKSLSQKEKELTASLENKSIDLTTLLENSKSASQEEITRLTSEIEVLKNDIAELQKSQEDRINPIIEDMQNLEKRFNKTINAEKDNISKEILNIDKTSKSSLVKETENLRQKIDELRIDTLQRFSQVGGGNANRQMFIGDVDPLTRYTDMNLKAGTNVTITYANNNQTRKVDVTFKATGGGGSVRSINSVAVDTSAGSDAGTDYVYIATAPLTITLPTASGNTNLYTIKNVSTGLVVIAFTGGETCDGQSSLTLATQYTSVDLISDSVNWAIT